MVGHSYGGVVAGRALLAGMDADTVVYGRSRPRRTGGSPAAAEQGELRAVRAPADPIGVVAGGPGLYGPDGVGAVPSLCHAPEAATECHT